MHAIDTAPYSLVEPRSEVVACGRCDRYTPMMVAKLREGCIQAHMHGLMTIGMSERQARIVCVSQLESWENSEFEHDCD